MKTKYSLLALTVLLLHGTGLVLAGAEASRSETAAKPVSLKVTSMKEQVGNIDTVTRVFVTTETNRFTFIVPKHFRFHTDDADQSLSLTTSDASGLIKLRISERSGNETPKLSPQTVRESLLESHPDAKVMSEFSASAGSLIGVGVELQWRATSDAMLSSRIALIPFPGGTLEFSQTARAQGIRQLDQALNQVLLSFRQAPIGGNLNIAPLSDKL